MESHLKRPASFQSSMNGAVADAYMLGPLGQVHSHAVMGDEPRWQPRAVADFRGHRFINGPPAKIEASAQCRARDAQSLRPLRKRQCDAVMGDEVIAAAVVVLPDHGRPAHVARLVIAVIVDAIKRVLPRWTSANVSKKCLKGRQPRITHADTTTPVVGIFRSLRIGAARFHVAPRSVFGRLVAAVTSCMTMCSAHDYKHITWGMENWWKGETCR